MKKTICLLLAFCMLFALAACGAEPEVKDWSRAGYFTDDSDNMLSVTWMEDIDEPGWYVGLMIGDLMAGCTLPQENGTLHGNLNAWDETAEPLIVTVSEEGEDGLLLEIEGGESYHFKPYDMPVASIVVYVNTEGLGYVGYVEGEDASGIDRDFPGQSVYIGLAEPAVHTFAAWPQAGYVFVKWTKNGEDFSTEPQFTLLLDESADFVAVFEEDPDWQNPVMNFVGEYQCDRAHAVVECFGYDEAWITIEWGSSAWEEARWFIVGPLDLDTLSIEYSGVTKSIVTYDENGEIKSEVPEYEDGSGSITFHEDGTFTWHEDQSAYGVDMVFKWLPPAPEREDGERFEDVIVIEGMEETVHYEHFINETLGFAMDYDYERFVRQSEEDRERFVSEWDDPANPENYLELTYRAEDTETVAASVRESLSQTYDLIEEWRELDRAGECIYIEASVVKGTNNMADMLQLVYIIPASDGCIVAEEHLAIEASEGFGRRFACMLNTLSVLER